MINRIAEIRRAEGLTQTQLAKALSDRLGRDRPFDQTTVSAYERGATGVPDPVKLALADILRCSLPWLMGWDNDNPGPAKRKQVAA